MLKQWEMPLLWLVLVGGLLWGFEGITGSELQEMLLGQRISDAIEIAVGVAAALLIYLNYTGSSKKSRR